MILTTVTGVFYEVNISQLSNVVQVREFIIERLSSKDYDFTDINKVKSAVAQKYDIQKFTAPALKPSPHISRKHITMYQSENTRFRLYVEYEQSLHDFLVDATAQCYYPYFQQEYISNVTELALVEPPIPYVPNNILETLKNKARQQARVPDVIQLPLLKQLFYSIPGVNLAINGVKSIFEDQKDYNQQQIQAPKQSWKSKQKVM